MAEKLQGAAINHNGWIEFDQAPDESGPWQKATLVIGDERVFTDSEVRAMFMALRQNEFFEDSGTMLMHVDDFDERVASFSPIPHNEQALPKAVHLTACGNAVLGHVLFLFQVTGKKQTA